MVQISQLPILVLPLSFPIQEKIIYKIFTMSQTFLPIYCLFLKFLNTIMCTLSFTLILLSWRIAARGKLFFTVRIREVYIISTLKARCTTPVRYPIPWFQFLLLCGINALVTQWFRQSIVTRSNWLPVSNKSFSFCHSCHFKKSCKLPFSTITASYAPLSLIVSNLWGPSPILSKDDFRYYLLLMDAYSHYTCIYPLVRKSDILSVFVTFKNKIENLFNTKIKVIKSDKRRNIRNLYHFLIHKVFFIVFLVPIHLNKMDLQSIVTDISLKLVSSFYTMPQHL